MGEVVARVEVADILRQRDIRIGHVADHGAAHKVTDLTGLLHHGDGLLRPGGISVTDEHLDAYQHVGVGLVGVLDHILVDFLFDVGIDVVVAAALHQGAEAEGGVDLQGRVVHDLPAGAVEGGNGNAAHIAQRGDAPLPELFDGIGEGQGQDMAVPFNEAWNHIVTLRINHLACADAARFCAGLKYVGDVGLVNAHVHFLADVPLRIDHDPVFDQQIIAEYSKWHNEILSFPAISSRIRL